MAADMNLCAWLTWVVVGVAVGLLSGRVLGGRRVLYIDLLISITGACLGGWGSSSAIGDGTPQLYIISVLVALFVSGGLLWIFNALMRLFNK